MYKSVVALYGVPRSGTSWLGQILDSCPDIVFRFQPLFSYRFKNRITTESTKEDIEYFFQELYCEDKDIFLNQIENKKRGMYPLFERKEQNPSVLAYKEVRYLYTIPLLLQRYDGIKIIGIVRNPYDVLESWINAYLEYKPEWDIFQEWLFATKKNEYRPENYFGYYKWKEFIKMNVEMQKKYPDNYRIVRYEKLAEKAIYVTKDLFDFLDIPYTAQTEKFLKDSQSKTIDNAYAVYRNKNEVQKKDFYLPNAVRKDIAKDLADFTEAKILGYY